MNVFNKKTMMIFVVCLGVGVAGYWQLSLVHNETLVKEKAAAESQQEIDAIEAQLQAIAKKMSHLYKASQDTTSDVQELVLERDSLELQLAKLEDKLSDLLVEQKNRQKYC
jgi:peptidoglycan hydrolase CwlO-like protein